MSDKQLAERLFPSAPGKPVYKMPDYAYVYREMQMRTPLPEIISTGGTTAQFRRSR